MRPLPLAALVAAPLAILAVFGIAQAGTTAQDPTAPPPLVAAEAYEMNVEMAVFNGPRAEVIAHLQNPETGVLANTQPTDRIPAISALEPVSGTFPEVGSVRRVVLETGDSVVERVLRYDQDAFIYQVWGFTAPNARALDHIRGQFQFEDTADGGTQVTWTYAINPRIGLARPFVRSFLTNDFAPFMESGLQGAAAAYNASR